MGIVTQQSPVVNAVAGVALNAVADVAADDSYMMVSRTAYNAAIAEALYTDPITGLPIYVRYDGLLEALIAEGNPDNVVLFFDLNNFKVVNTLYGYHRGTLVIKAIAAILSDVAAGRPVAKIGGDDFIMIASAGDVDTICQQVLHRFGVIAPAFYDEADRQRGYVEAADRKGRVDRFDFTGVAIGIVPLRPCVNTLATLYQRGEDMLLLSKRDGGYVVDRRER